MLNKYVLGTAVLLLVLTFCNGQTKNDSITEIPDPAPRVPGSHPGKGLAATRKRRVSKRAGPK